MLYYIRFHLLIYIPVDISPVQRWEEFPQFGVRIGSIFSMICGRQRRFVITQKVDNLDPDGFSSILTND